MRVCNISKRFDGIDHSAYFCDRIANTTPLSGVWEHSELCHRNEWLTYWNSKRPFLTHKRASYLPAYLSSPFEGSALFFLSFFGFPKSFCTFVVRQSDIRITYTYRRQLQRRVPCVLSVTDSHSVARKRGTRLSFSYILNLFNTKCDRVKQVVRPRTRVRAPQLSHNYPSPEWNPGKEFSDSFFGFPESLCTFVVRTGALRTYKVNTKHALRRCPLSASTCVVATSSQNSGATPLFVHIQTFDDKCELVSKVIRAKYYPDYNVHPTKRGKSINYSHEPLADSENLRIFVSPNSAIALIRYIRHAISKRCSCSASVLCSCAVWQNKRDNAFFVVPVVTKLLTEQCQTELKVLGGIKVSLNRSNTFYTSIRSISIAEAMADKALALSRLQEALIANYGDKGRIDPFVLVDAFNAGILYAMEFISDGNNPVIQKS